MTDRTLIVLNVHIDHTLKLRKRQLAELKNDIRHLQFCSKNKYEKSLSLVILTSMYRRKISPVFDVSEIEFPPDVSLLQDPGH